MEASAYHAGSLWAFFSHAGHHEINSTDLAIYLPPSGGSVTVRKLPDGVNRVRAHFELQWDFWVFAWLVLGYWLTSSATSLAQSSTVHATIGGVVSLALVSAFFLFWLWKQMRESLPFGGGGLTLVTAGFLTFVPAARNLISSWIMVMSRSHWWYLLNAKDPFYDLPLGWIVLVLLAIIASVVVLSGARIAVLYFARPPDPDGEVPFSIGSDGRRIDHLPSDPIPQKCLAWALYIAGVALLLFSFHADTISFFAALIVVGERHIMHVLHTCWLSRHATSPMQYRRLISNEKYRDLSHQHTTRAIQQLHNHVSNNRHLYGNFQSDSELRLRRFVDNGVHVDRRTDDMLNGQKKRCAIL